MSTYLWLDTLNLNDQVNYSLGKGWKPRVARRRRSGLGGWIYEDVVESIPLRIFSKVSLDACLDARDAIVARLDRAEGWSRDEPVDVVLLKCKVDGSSLTNPLQSEVLAGDGDDLLELGAEFNETVKAWEIQAVIRVKRKGDLLGDVDSDTSSAGGPATLLTCTLAESLPLYSPLSVELAGMNYQTASAGLYEINIPQGVLLIASAATRLKLIEAESFDSAVSSPVTDVADAAASGGHYIRMTSGQSVRYTGIDTSDIEGDLIGVYAMCHLTSSTDQWSLYTSVFRDGSIGADESAQTIIINGQTGYKPVKLGVLGRASDTFTLNITPTRLSGSGNFEIDVMGLIALGSLSERVVAVNSLVFFDAVAAATQLANMGVRHNRLESRLPSGYVEFANGSEGAGLPYDGNIHLASIGDTVVATWLAGGNQWRHNDDAGVVSLSLAVGRRRAYLASR